MDPTFLVNVLIIPIAGMITAVVITAGFFRTVRHYIDRKGGQGAVDPNLAPEIADLHARIDTLERRGDRVDELEDRLDFAERFLARSSQSETAGRDP